MKESDIRRGLEGRLSALLPEAEIRWERLQRAGDAAARLRINGHRLILAVKIVNQPNAAKIRSKLEEIRRRRGAGQVLPVLVAPALNAELRKKCDEAGVGYIDLNGNISLRQGPILIKKEVEGGAHYHEARERSPFADRASLILRYLLEGSKPYGVREVAEAVGVSPGYASKVLRRAADLEYAARDAEDLFRLRNRAEVLADWSSFYQWSRNRRLSHYCSLSAAQIESVLRRESARASKPSFALSLHCGNNRVKPLVDYDSWHVYALQDEMVGRLSKALELRPVGPEAANFVFMHPFYRESVAYRARQMRALWVVSDLQLYLDLRHFPVRGSEAAEAIMRRLQKAWPSEP